MEVIMTPQQIDEAKARAAAVLDGFRTPHIQLARDAFKLAELLQLRERQITAMAAQISTQRGNAGKVDFDELFRGVFGRRA